MRRLVPGKNYLSDNFKIMIIKRNVYFSAVDEYGDERLFSTTELMNEEDYIERLYGDIELNKLSSGRGYVRSSIGGPGGWVGTYVGKEAADKADMEGKSDYEIRKAARRAGGIAGAATMGGLGAGLGARYALKNNESVKAALAAAEGAKPALSSATASYQGAKEAVAAAKKAVADASTKKAKAAAQKELEKAVANAQAAKAAKNAAAKVLRGARGKAALGIGATTAAVGGIGALAGGLGGSWGAGKNTRERLKTRAYESHR
jgi:hypothetical protein